MRVIIRDVFVGRAGVSRPQSRPRAVTAAIRKNKARMLANIFFPPGPDTIEERDHLERLDRPIH